jgi:hypothetical protein
MRSAIDVRGGAARSNRYRQRKGGLVKKKGTPSKVRTMMLVVLISAIPMLMGIGNCFRQIPVNIN